MLSICMPSNRLLMKSKFSIESILRLSNMYDIESIIFDNSLELEKSNYIEGQALATIYNKNAPTGVADNWSACMSAASREFILMVGDDDRLCLLSDPQDYLHNLHVSDVGVRPIFIPFSGTQGVLSVESFSTDAETAKDRLKQYFSMSNGKNLSFYSIYRKEIFIDLMLEFYDFHPTKAGFTDWSLSLALISMGKIKSNKNIIFYYNMDNWSSNEAIGLSNVGIFKSAGLPLDSMCIQSAFTALDSFALIAREKSPISKAEKYDAAIFAMLTYYNALIVSLKSNTDINISEKVKLALDLIEIDHLSDSQRIINLLTVVETWVPGLAKKYQDYFVQTIDPVILEMIS